MESRRFLLAIVLMIATVVVVNVIFPPVRRPAPTTPGADTARANPQQPQPAAAAGQPTTAPATLPAPAPVATSGTVDTVVVQSPIYRYGISTQGAALVSAELLNYESQNRPGPVQLAPASPRGLLSYRFRADAQTIDFASITFKANHRGDIHLEPTDSSASLELTGMDASGRNVAVTYTFRPNDYVIDVVARVSGNTRGAQLLLDLGPTLAFNDKNRVEDRRALAYVVNSRKEGIRSVPFQSMRGGTHIDEGPLAWVALKNKYFLVAALPSPEVPDASFGGLIAEDLPGADQANLTAILPFTGEETAQARLFVGPQEYDRLVAINQQLEDVNPYGWRWLRPVIRPLGHAFTWILLGMHRVTGLAYGWVLILFGIGIRLVLWPLNAKAMRSQMKNMQLQPRIKDIQTRHKNNPEQLQKEMLKLYREEGFNPMGGCFPMLLPMPILITLFFVFQSTIEFRGESFLWLPDLSQRDPLYILPLLLGATMFIQQWLSMRGSPPNPQMQMMTWFMPAFMVVLFLNFASGLNLYYTAQNFASFPQQLQLMRERERLQGKKIGGVGLAR